MTFLQKHMLALCIAAFVGLCASAPAVLAPRQLGNAYDGMQYMYQDDEDIYRARMQEILDGRGLFASPFLHEYKDVATNVAPVGEWFYALPAFVFGLSPVLLAFKFLLPAVLFFLVYLFVKRLIGRDCLSVRLTAIAAGLLVTLGYDFIDHGYMRAILSGGEPGLLIWTRTVNPILGAIGLFGLLLSLWALVEHGRRLSIALAGLILAALVGYYFAWGMGLSVMGVLFLAYLAQREFTIVRNLFYVGLVSIIASTPYFYMVLGTVRGEEGVKAAMRTGLVFTHEFVFNKFLLLATVLVAICFAYAYWRGIWRQNQRSWIFIAALILSGWIAFNQQVITGRQIWFHHFVQYTIPFSYVAVIAAGYLSFREIAPRVWTAGVISLSLLCGAYGLYSTTSFIPKKDDFARLQEYGPVMRWFNAVQTPCVVLTVEEEEKAAKLVPAYTHCDVYFTSVVFNSVPDERILHNYLLQLRLRGVSENNIEQYLRSHELEVRGATFTNWDELFGRGEDAWLDFQIQRLTDSYRTFLKGDLEEQMRTYWVDYILAEGELSQELLAQMPHVTEREVVGRFYIYTFE